MITFADLKWLAGFLEGEACFSNYDRKGYISVVASQVEPWPLEECYRLLGGSINQRRPSKYYPGAQDLGVWKISGETAAGVMMTLYPLMSPKRKREIAAALTKWRTQRIATHKQTVCLKGHPFDRVARDGKRKCSICDNRRANESRYRNGKRGAANVIDIRQASFGA